jgi:hypothetical protein
VEITHTNYNMKVNTRESHIYELTENNSEEKCKSFEEYLDKSNEKIKYVLDNLIIYDKNKLLDSNQIAIACDGSSVDNNKGSFGLSIASNQEVVAINKSKIPQIYGILPSYRSECYGILTATYLYYMILKYTKNNKSKGPQVCQIICDNEAAIKIIHKLKNLPNNTKQFFNPDADIIQETLHHIKMIQQMGGNIKYKHIKGHQDRNKNKLSFEAELNVMADQLAEEAMKLTQMEHYSLPNTKAELFLDNLFICKNHKQTLRDAYQSIDMHSYYQEKYGWSNHITENMWWMIHGKAFPNFNASVQSTIIKYIHGRLPCNHRENIYYEYKSAVTCHSQTETQEHVIQCNGCEERIKNKKNYLRNLYRIMENNETDKNLARVIGTCVTNWINGEDITNLKVMTDNPPKILIDAYKEQKHIGWDQFMKGRLTIKWGEAYNKYRSEEKINKKYLTAEKWGKDIIVVSWKFVMDIWKNRNENEHGDEATKVEKQKKKLVEKIKWLQKKNTDLNESYHEINIEKDIMKLPINNLLMMEMQLSKEKVDRRTGGQGESLPLNYKK